MVCVVGRTGIHAWIGTNIDRTKPQKYCIDPSGHALLHPYYLYYKIYTISRRATHQPEPGTVSRVRLGAVTQRTVRSVPLEKQRLPCGQQILAQHLHQLQRRRQTAGSRLRIIFRLKYANGIGGMYTQYPATAFAWPEPDEIRFLRIYIQHTKYS